jgi:hypothetical protein
MRDDGELGVVKGFSENMLGRCSHEWLLSESAQTGIKTSDF